MDRNYQITEDQKKSKSSPLISLLNKGSWILFVLALIVNLWLIFINTNHYDPINLWVLYLIFTVPLLIIAAILKIVISWAIKKSNAWKEILLVIILFFFSPIAVYFSAKPFYNNSLHDEWLSHSLFEIDMNIRSYYQDYKSIPDDSDKILDMISTYTESSDYKKDLDSGEIKYEKIDDSHFRLCGNFKSKSQGFTGYKTYQEVGRAIHNYHNAEFYCWLEDAEDIHI